MTPDTASGTMVQIILNPLDAISQSNPHITPVVTSKSLQMSGVLMGNFKQRIGPGERIKSMLSKGEHLRTYPILTVLRLRDLSSDFMQQ